MLNSEKTNVSRFTRVELCKSFGKSLFEVLEQQKINATRKCKIDIYAKKIREEN